jgi:hypothetical protein
MAVSTSGDEFPDIKNALRAAWLAAQRQHQASCDAADAAQRALSESKLRLEQVERQIEAAAPSLGFDPAEVMAPLSDEGAEEQAPPHSFAATAERAQYEERVTDLLADGRLLAGETLRTVHRGQEYRAKVEANGFISGSTIGSKPTLSAAARALVGGERNGWKFWTVQRDGRWVPVADLRRG